MTDQKQAMNVFELAVAHMMANGMSEENACAVLEYYGAREGRCVRWADIQPHLFQAQIDRIESAAVGWLLRLSAAGGDRTRM